MKKYTETPLFKRLGSKNAFALTFAVLCAVLCAILIILSLIPKGAMTADLTKDGSFSVSDDGKKLAAALDCDVTLYLIASGGAPDTRMLTILNEYASASDSISVQVLHAEGDMGIIRRYVSYSSACDGGIIAVSEKRSLYVAPETVLSYSEGALINAMSYYNSYAASDSSVTFSQFLSSYGAYLGLYDGFCHEQVISTALTYVTSDNVRRLGFISGANAEFFSDALLFSFAENMIELFDLSLASDIPDGTDGILIMPTGKDVTASEKQKLSAYVAGGGKVTVSSSYGLEKGYENLSALCAEMGISSGSGYVFEDDARYYYSSPETLIPVTADEKNLFLPLCTAITVADTPGDGVKVTPLLFSSDTAYVKTELKDGLAFNESTDVRGKRTLAVKSENASGGAICYFASSFILTDDFNYYSGGVNQSFFFSVLNGTLGAQRYIPTAPVKAVSTAPIAATENALYGVIAAGLILTLGSLAVGLIGGLKRNGEQ